MSNIIKKIIQEEFEKINKFSEKDIYDAIINKKFIHTISGGVYSPVSMKDGILTGVNDDYQHVVINIDEISIIETAGDRFGK